ncbi:MAG: DNA polymerase domain-containing protein, partial [Promethearchaeota archaeon]
MSPVNTVYQRGSGDRREIEVKGRLVVDLMESYDEFYGNEQLETKALEPICKEEVDIEESDFDYSKLEKDNWKNHIDEIIEYNKLDVERMVKLDRELNIIEHFESIRRTTGCLFDQSYRTSGFVDSLMLRKYKDKYVLPRAKKSEKKKFEGGFVKLFTGSGLYKWVAVLDFSSHYPTAIKNYNMSPETLVDKPKNAYTVDTEMGKVYFKKDKRGILPKVFDEMGELRNEMKKKRDNNEDNDELWKYYHKRQYVLKTIINSFFGYFGYPGSRLYIPELAASVTAIGREYILQTVDYAKEEYGYQSRYSDSLDYKRKITVKNKKSGNIENVEIGKFVEEYDCKNYETLSMDLDSYNTEFKNVVQGIKHNYDYNKKGKLLEFNTTRGKTVVTPQHSVYKMVDGKPKLVDAKNLEEGDELVSVSDISSSDKIKNGYELDLFNILNNEKLMAYKKDISIRGYIEKNNECPFCGKEIKSFSHIYTTHNDYKKDIEKANKDYKFIGGKNGGSGKIPRYWKIDKEFAWILGYFAADGSLSFETKKKMLSFGSQDREKIEKVKKYFDNKLGLNLSIIENTDNRTGNKMYYYRVQRIPIIYLFKDVIGTGYKSSGKKVPNIILNSEEELRKKFLEGYLDGDGYDIKKSINKYSGEYKKFDTKSNDLAIGVNYLLKTTDFGETYYNKNINQVLWGYRNDKKDINSLRTVYENKNYCGAKIREIKEVKPTKDSVYDIEVEDNHNFLDAEGNILVHNTDSIMVTLDAKDREEAVKLGKELERAINDFWKKKAENEELYGRPKLECEKIYKRMFFKEAKKRYAGRKIWEEGKYTDELDVTGFEIVRTDESITTKEAQRGLFEIIFSDEGEKDKEVAESEVSAKKIKLMNNHLEEIRYKMENPSNVTDIAKPKPIRQAPRDFAVPYAVHGILWSNKHLNKEFGITDSKAYIIYLDKLPDKYGKRQIWCAKKKGGKKQRRKLKRIALSEEDDIREWIEYIDIDKHYQKQV